MTNQELSRKFTIEASLDSIDDLAVKVSNEISGFMGSETGFRVGLIITELCTNIVKHGYKREAGKQIDVSIKTGDGNIEITIEDSSFFFNPLTIEDVDLSNVDSLQHGGMGIYIVRRLAKKLNYQRLNGKNILTIIL